MQIVQLSGGLGNQLFQYAYYLKLNKLGYETYMDDISRYKDGKERNNQLCLIGADYAPARENDILRLRDRDRKIADLIRRRICGSRDVERHEGDEITEDGYWTGYWQSAEGYSGIERDLRENVFGERFEDEVTYSDIKQRIENSLSVGVHIRRGDYLSPEVQHVYGGICTDKYYESALKYMRDKYPGCIFYIFSNDPDWVKENYAVDDVVVMEGNDEEHGYRDMYLMSKCKHNIIANSSFSWWGGWLNTNPDKCVIGPSIWIHREGFNKIYEEFNVVRVTPEGEFVNER
ncbi:Glycosyl transferase family 11 [Lachnospiraceae bacterium G11]|nr:Glycosyl transferase family 11 [Lachnospiraceae bacterium G11]